MRQKWIACLSGFAVIVLILDTKTAVMGASEGIKLCLEVVIPSLFPFFIASIMLCNSLAGSNIKLLRPIGKLLRIPKGSEVLLLTGLLGGYPVGAQNIALAYQSGRLEHKDATRMIAFSSNAGPAFLFGMGMHLFPNGWICFMIWAIHIISAWIVGVITPGNSRTSAMNAPSKPISLSAAMRKSIIIMASVCGWVVIFRVILAFSQVWFLWILPEAAQYCLHGLMELSNGCCSLTSCESLGMRIVFFCGCISFGGLCVAMQTHSVCDGLNTKLYLPGKITQCACSIMLCAPVQHLLQPADRWYPHVGIYILCICVIAGYAVLTRKMKNNSSISEFACV